MNSNQNKQKEGTSLAVQWLGLHASTAGGSGSITGWGTDPPGCAAQPKKKKNKHKEIHEQTHHTKNAESQRQGENCKSSKRKTTCHLQRHPSNR